MIPTGLFSNITHCIGSKSALISCLSNLSGVAAYSVILGVLIICGLGVPIPEDITLITAGILAALGKISLTGAILISLFGVLIGDSILFFLGRHMGKNVFQLPILKTLMPQHRIKQAEQKVLANSKFVCFVARFLPGLRTPIFLTSGVMGVKPAIFIGLDGLAALISVPIWVYIGWWIGEKWDENLKLIKQIQIYLFIMVGILVVGYFLLRRHQKRKLKQNSTRH